MDDKTKTEIRHDNAQVVTEKRFDRFGASASVVKTDEGFLKVQMRATRVGVFKYLRKDGSIVRELRHPDDVFAPESLATLSGKPITLLHPKNVPNGLVTSKNVATLSVGLTGDNVEVVDNSFVDTTGTITNDRGVREVEKRMDRNEDQEVSCGYKCDMIEESGVFNGEVYDRRQVNIRYNHVALVPKGRAGNNCKLRLDEDEAILYDKHIDLEDPMETIKIDGQEFEVSSEIAKAFLKHEAKHDEALKTSKKETAKAEAKADTLSDELAEANKSKDKAEAKADGLEEENKTLKEKVESKMDGEEIDALVEERTKVCEVASKLVKEFKKDGKSNLEIKKEVILAVSPDMKLDEKSEDYIEARFDGIVENAESYTDKLKDKINGQTKQDNADNNNNETKFDSAEARKRMLEQSTNAWEQPLSTTRE